MRINKRKRAWMNVSLIQKCHCTLFSLFLSAFSHTFILLHGEVTEYLFLVLSCNWNYFSNICERITLLYAESLFTNSSCFHFSTIRPSSITIISSAFPIHFETPHLPRISFRFFFICSVGIVSSRWFASLASCGSIYVAPLDVGTTFFGNFCEFTGTTASLSDEPTTY